ncbi:hypothetical protein TWF506_006133 [Arthrobotrys conoides]|uniref:Ricin B lectin domain-containing protein n=1 Tax=Arthrobotrys conoides TaxID=74498 RepID=A0AAN8NGS1_9PEZI
MDDIQDRKRRRSRSPSLDLVEKRATKITKQDVEEVSQPLKRVRSGSLEGTDDRSKKLRHGPNSWDLEIDIKPGSLLGTRPSLLKVAGGLLTPLEGPSIEYQGCFIFNPYFATFGLDGTLTPLSQEAMRHLAPSEPGTAAPPPVIPTPEPTPGELQNNPLENASSNLNSQSPQPSLDINHLVVIGDINAYGLLPGKLEIYHNVTAHQPYAEIFRPKTSSFSLGAFFPSMKGHSIDAIELQNVSFSYLAYGIDRFEVTGVYLKSDVIFKGVLQPVSDVLHEYFGQENPSIHLSAYIGAVRDWNSFPSPNKLILTGSIEHMSAKLFNFLEFTRVGVELLMDADIDLSRRSTKWHFGYGFFGDVNISVPGSVVPLQCHYHFRKFSESFLLSITLRDDEWKEVFGFKGLNLSAVHFQAMVTSAAKDTQVNLRVEAEMQWHKTTISIGGSFGSGEYSLDAYIGDLSLQDIGELFKQMMDVELDIFDHDVVLQSMYLNISNKGFILAGTVIINGHSSASGRVAFMRDGISITGGVKDMSFEDIDIHKAELDVFIGTKSQKNSARETKFAIMGDVSFAGIDLRVGVYTKKPSNGKLEWAIYGEASGDLKTSRLCPALEGTFLDISLTGVALMAANHNNGGGSYNIHEYPVVSGIQFCAKIKSIPALEELLRGSVDGTTLRAQYSNGSFKLGLTLPCERTMTFGPNIYTGALSLYIETGKDISLGLEARLNIKLKSQDDPLRFDLGIKAGALRASAYGGMSNDCQWRNPCGIGKNVVISGCAVDFSILYATFATTLLPERIGIKGRLDIGEKKADGAMVVSQDPSEELFFADVEDMGVVDLVKFASLVLEKDLPHPDNFLHFTKFEFYLSTGVKIMDNFYPRGASLKGDMRILGKTAKFDCRIGPDIKISATIEAFSIGPLTVTGAVGKDPVVDAELSSTVQRVYIDGAVSIWGASAAIHLNADFHPSPKLNFAIQLKLSDLFLVQLRARITGQVNYKDLKSFENADFEIYGLLEQHIIEEITKQVEQQIDTAQEALKKGCNKYREAFVESEKEFNEGCRKASQKLKEAEVVWHKKRDDVQKFFDDAEKLLKDTEKSLKDKLDEAERIWKQACAEARLFLQNAEAVAASKINAAEAVVRKAGQDGDDRIREAKEEVQRKKDDLYRGFGAAEKVVREARYGVEWAQRKVESINDEIDRKTREMNEAGPFVAASFLPVLAVLRGAQCGAWLGLETAKRTLRNAEESLNTTAYIAATAAVATATLELEGQRLAKDLAVLTAEKALNELRIAQKALVKSAMDAIDTVETASEELRVFKAASLAVNVGCKGLKSGVDNAQVALDGLAKCGEFLAFDLAQRGLEFAEKNSAKMNLAKHALDLAEKGAHLGLDIAKWAASAAGKILDINKIEFEGSLKSLIADGPPLRAFIQGMLCGDRFAIEVVWKPHFNLVEFIKALFERLWEMIKSGSRAVALWANGNPESRVCENTKYMIVNVATGTAIDLSGMDRTSVSSWTVHGAENQQWTFESHEDHWRIRNVGTGRYLAPSESFDKINDGTRIISSADPADWNIGLHEEASKVAYRMFVPNYHRPINFDLMGASSADGAPIALWGMWDGRHQLWYFKKG